LAPRRLDLNALTGTRFFAAMTVVFHHFGKNLPELGPDHWILRPIFCSGYESVAYFFCLSGFVMAVVYGDTPRWDLPHLRSFAVARFARIYPIYLLALLFALWLPAWRATPLNETLDILLVQSWVPGHTISINPPAWSLSTEAFFYMLFPLLLRWIQGMTPGRMLAAAAWIWAASIVPFVVLCNTWVGPYLSPSFDIVYYSPVFNLNTFVAGMAAGLALKRSADRLPQWTGWKAEAITTLAMVLFGAALVLQDWVGPHTGLNLPFTNGMLAPVHVAVMACLAVFPSAWSRFLGCRLLVFLGGASYAIYLFQCPVRTWYEIHVLSTNPFIEEASFGFYAVLLIAVSALAFRFVETPIRAALKRLVSA
jgi:peptidoglycan/LPS O-acetylase OafA/YrhL